MSQQERNEIFSDCVDSLKLWKELIYKYADDDSGITQQLEEVVKDYCRTDYEASVAEKACAEVVSQVEEISNNNNSQERLDIDQLYQNKLTSIQNSSFNPEQHQIWKEIMLNERSELDVEEVQPEVQNNQSMVYEEVQDQVFCSTTAFTPSVDPISKKAIQDAYKSRTCGHIYEYKFILQYIKSMKNKAKCPFIGCGNKSLTLTELFKDQDTQDKIDNYSNSQRSVNHESDNESDDE